MCVNRHFKQRNYSMMCVEIPVVFTPQPQFEEVIQMSKGENIFKRKDGRWEARYIKGYELSGNSFFHKM